MNALHPAPIATQFWPDAARAARLVDRLCALYLALALAVMLLLTSPVTLRTLTLRFGGLGAVCLGALLLPLAGLLATRPLTAARLLLDRAPPDSRWRPLPARLARWVPQRRHDPALRLSRLGRRPQGIIVPAIALCAAAAAWTLKAGAILPESGDLVLGGAAILLGFPLLICERIMAAASRTSLPEAAGLQNLLFVPTLALPVAGLLELGAAAGVPHVRIAMALIAVYLVLVALELTLRALANWFLPLPAPQDARAAIASLLALLLRPGRLAPDGLAAPIRTHLGLDFSRSWALRYARSAALPVGLALGLIAWGLTGVSLIPLDQRGIYERLGAPVAVWRPGAHLGLPWPLGRVRPVDLGIVHAVLLGGDAETTNTSAEAPPPTGADRLWDRVHPSEVSYLIASREGDGRQGFQTVSVDLKALYRIGADDRSALRAAYAVSSPDAVVRSEAGRLMASVFAGRTLDEVLGAGRERMGEELQRRLQTQLDALGTGIDLVAIVIEAIHPPAGAAEAYHNVQAAEIIANTAIATERGRALAAAARSRQSAADLTLGAQGAAAETVSTSRVGARTFTADHDAYRVGGDTFLLERYFANIAQALAKSPLVIIDHRLTGSDAPSIDLRSFGAPTPRQGEED